MPFRPDSIVIERSVEGKFSTVDRAAARGEKVAVALRKSLRTAISRIKADGQWGEVIPPASIPETYKARLGVTNLYCVDLALFHRLFYTIRERHVILIDLVDHVEYDRLMQ